MSVFSRRSIVSVFLLVAAFAASIAHAQSGQAGAWPQRPIRIVVSYPPGGGADLTARVAASTLGEVFGQSIIVENRPGANGITGSEAVARSAPDGYTILVTDRGALGINPSLYAKLPYDSLRDFEHIGIGTWGPYVLVVPAKLPVTTFEEFLRLARSQPGVLNYSSFGIGSISQLNFEALNARYGINVVHVPYKGAAAAIAAAVAGEVSIAMSTFPAAIGHIRDGRVRPIAVGAAKRASLLPDVPTIVEVGGTVDTVAQGFFSFSAPAGTPRPIVQRLSEEIRKALQKPDAADRLQKAGLDAAGSTPQEMVDVVRGDIERFARIVKGIGIKPE